MTSNKKEADLLFEKYLVEVNSPQEPDFVSDDYEHVGSIGRNRDPRNYQYAERKLALFAHYGTVEGTYLDKPVYLLDDDTTEEVKDMVDGRNTKHPASGPEHGLGLPTRTGPGARYFTNEDRTIFFSLVQDRMFGTIHMFLKKIQPEAGTQNLPS